MRWATRRGIHIDRAASAWLIRRILDPNPEFVFVRDLAEVPPDASRSTCVAWSSGTRRSAAGRTALSRRSCVATN
ncbi:chromate resistance protein ChrB domain-containing protein [Pseudonocardia halophobica]|uniref:chromate resistance protein ChrB domain-containing protein n=1 Tax=Pseudonocardia halophobica TaxID=29401 RepID=UPI003D93AD47